MLVLHKSLQKDNWTEIILPVKAGVVSVKNKTNGEIKVSIEKEDPENYVTIDKGEKEELFHCLTSSCCPCNFFRKIYVYSDSAGEIEIRCIKI